MRPRYLNQTVLILLVCGLPTASFAAPQASFDKLLQDSEKAQQVMHSAEALTLVNQYLQHDPGNLKAHAVRASVLKDLGRFQAALSDADLLVAEKKDASSLRFRAKIYEMLKRPEDAIIDLEKAIKLDPSDHGAWSNLAFDYRRVNNYREAARCFDCAVKFPGKDADIYTLMVREAEMYFLTQDYKKSLACYEKIITKYPDFSGGYYGKAKIVEMQGEHVQAAKLKEKGKEADLGLEPSLAR